MELLILLINKFFTQKFTQKCGVLMAVGVLRRPPSFLAARLLTAFGCKLLFNSSLV